MKAVASRMGLIAGGALVLACAGGCAFIPETARIAYTPQANVSRIPNAEGVKVQVKMNDLRPMPKVKVSHKMNAYGMHTAVIRADRDVGTAVEQAMTTELQQRGFGLGDGGAVVNTDLNRFYCDWQAGFWSGSAVAELNMNVKVNKPGQDAYTYVRLIRGEGVKKGSQVTSGRGAGNALNRALADGMLRLFKDEEFIQALLKAAGATPPEAASAAAPTQK